MFKTKYIATIINSKWERLKNKPKLSSIPNKDELLYFDGKYYKIINIIHSVDSEHQITIVVDELLGDIKINLPDLQ